MHVGVILEPCSFAITSMAPFFKTETEHVVSPMWMPMHRVDAIGAPEEIYYRAPLCVLMLDLRKLMPRQGYIIGADKNLVYAGARGCE